MRSWWAGKGDRLVKETFKVLKIKQQMDHLPLLVNEHEQPAKDEKENERIILDYYRGLMEQLKIIDEVKRRARQEVLACIPTMIKEEDKKTLGEALTVEEIT
ncbi:hypothetical protein O6H91_04G097000 [Diphasiastrum complanatum]|uniref:Uncharacterized protein n=1 Tax=Diphasiastrum complanatum TaxID=34168 RepID=A0ACC2DZL1_DIPCM|nr:hypothetical protein O6H91_04G097000 [Diphasiastrum complanatum]